MLSRLKLISLNIHLYMLTISYLYPYSLEKVFNCEKTYNSSHDFAV